MFGICLYQPIKGTKKARQGFVGGAAGRVMDKAMPNVISGNQIRQLFLYKIPSCWQKAVTLTQNRPPERRTVTLSLTQGLCKLSIYLTQIPGRARNDVYLQMFGICLYQSIKGTKKARQGLWEVLPGGLWIKLCRM